jgi:hypothetical protein
MGNVRTVVCFVPAKTDTKFFHSTLIKEADLYFIEGRPCFFKKDGTSEGTKVATMLVMFGATDQQRMRFAELVSGAWWLPGQAASGRIKKAPASSLEATKDYGPLSCVAPFAPNASNWTVLCSPSAGPTPIANLA